MRDHFEYYWKSYVFGVLGVLLAGLIVVTVFRNTRDTSLDGYDSVLEMLESESQSTKETFSILGEYKTVSKHGGEVIELDLYLKKPFIRKQELDFELVKLSNLLKYQLEVRAIRFHLYDREIAYALKARPIGEYYYAIPFDRLPREEQVRETSADTPNQQAYDYTVSKSGRIDYRLYQVFGDFRELILNTGVEPLTDQEYEWFVKYDIYQTLGGGIKTMLEWEYGVSPNQRLGLVEREASQFISRLAKLGDRTTLFDGQYLTKIGYERKLAGENPSFLLYLKTGEIDENEVSARARLLEKFPGEYDEAINRWIDEKAKEAVREN